MKYQALTMTFPQDLTEEQEKILINRFQEVMDSVGVAINRSRNMLVPYSRIDIKALTLKNSLELLSNNLTEYIGLEKQSPKEYRFMFAKEMFSCLNMDLHLWKLHIRSDWNKKLDKKISKLLPDIFKHMKLNPTDVKIERSEVTEELKSE